MMRVCFRVHGQVQGVGFRPHVYRLAVELGLSGWVRNDAAGVEIAVQGLPEALEIFTHRLASEAPPLARIDGVEQTPGEAEAATGFHILPSVAGRATTAVTPDTAVCPACLAELFDPADRRYRYPFITCTHCGPRYTITARLPYDRPNTSMAAFALCPACRTEYENPLDRRFHAQPNACPACGPKVWLVEFDSPPPQAGEALHKGVGERENGDSISQSLSFLRQGKILAVKGLGGFHLMCDARNAVAVAQLRARKAREEKPFALLAANAASLAEVASWGAEEAALLQSPERPIVLLPKRPAAEAALSGVADGMPWLGAMLPATPLQYLLFHEAAGRPAGSAWLDEPQDLLLVCTSANPGGEPLVTGNDEALNRLQGIADALLLHDRDILARCDDSVVRAKDEGGRRRKDEGGRMKDEGETTTLFSSFILHPSSLQFLRRARGYTPRAIRLPRSGPPVLAVGGFFKNTVCVTRGDEAFLSPHIGELDNAATCEAFETTLAHLLDVLDISPAVVAHDGHPDFFSSRFAAGFAAERGLPVVAVQHHHAHIAAVAAEHGIEEPVLGLALDGVGLGADGTAWGGELLRVDGAECRRIGRLQPLALPGGDSAAREPWRMAASALHALGRGGEIAGRFPRKAAGMVAAMLERGLNAPLTSSCGRLFDAAAGLLGVKDVLGFEGQAAMLLEGLAHRHGPVTPLADGYTMTADELSFLPLLDRLADGLQPAPGAALFHATLAAGLAEWAANAAARENIGSVALGGGCFLNAILSEALARRLRERGLSVLEARQAPPNDGGLALGQAWVALQTD